MTVPFRDRLAGLGLHTYALLVSHTSRYVVRGKEHFEEAWKEDERVQEMLDLIRRKASTDKIIFVLDEVGQYIASRDDLILNLDGLAKNMKNIGRG